MHEYSYENEKWNVPLHKNERFQVLNDKNSIRKLCLYHNLPLLIFLRNHMKDMNKTSPTNITVTIFAVS